jgi:hypothetical protein
LETRVLRSSGECLPSTSISAGIPFDTPHLSTVRHCPRCHPACNQQSTNMAHPFQQPHPQRTLLCIELESTSVVPSCGTWHINLPIPPCTCNVGHYPAIPLISSTSCNNVLIVLPNDRRYEIFKLLQRIHGPHLWSGPRILHLPVHSVTEHLKLFLAFSPKSTNINCKKLYH